MTEEEKKAAEEAEAQKKQATTDSVIAAWLPNRGKSTEEEETSEKKETPSEEPVIPPPSHRGGVMETIQRAEIAQKQKEAEAQSKQEEEETSEQIAEEERNKAGADDKTKDKPPVKFSLRKPKESTPPADTPKPPEQQQQEQKKDEPAPGELSAEDQTFVESLPAELQDSIAFFKEAESVDPDAYKGKLQSAVDYYKRYEAEVKRMREEDDSFDPSSSPELQRWVRSQQDRPQIGFMEQQKILRKSVEKQSEQRIQQSERRIAQERHIAEQTPQVEKIVSDFSDGLSSEIPEEIMATFKASIDSGGDSEAALQSVSDTHGPEIAQAIRSTVNHSTDIAEAYVSLTRGVTQFDPKNPIHNEASNSVIALGKEMLTNPDLEKFRTNDKGQKFMPREVYFDPKTTPEERDKHFTFTEQQVLDMLKANSQKALKDRLASASEIVKQREARILKAHGIDPSKKSAANESSADDSDDETPPSRFGNDNQEKQEEPNSLVNAMVRGVIRDD